METINRLCQAGRACLRRTIVRKSGRVRSGRRQRLASGGALVRIMPRRYQSPKQGNRQHANLRIGRAEEGLQRRKACFLPARPASDYAEYGFDAE